MIGFKVRDFRNRGFWISDDEYMNGYAKHLGPTASMVYFSLCRHADKDQKSFPGQDLIADELGINKRVVMRKIKILVDWNIINKQKTKNSDGKWLNNTYFLLDKSEWRLPPTQKVHMDTMYIKSTEPPTQKMYIKDTHKKETHNPSIVSPNGDSQKNKPVANRLAGKPYSKQEWLLSLQEKDIKYIQEEFPDISTEKIFQVAKDCYFWQKAKGIQKKNQKMTLRNWIKNDIEWGGKKNIEGITYQQ